MKTQHSLKAQIVGNPFFGIVLNLYKLLFGNGLFLACLSDESISLFDKPRG
jgi:hypothetical protein